jgi:hypothetical protein
MISITLPSLFPNLAKRAIDNINATTQRPHEILVVSPFEIFGPNVVWVKEPKPHGVAYAQHSAAVASKGDFIAASADDYDFVDGWDDIIIPDFERRESLYPGKFYSMGLRYAVDDLVGTVFGIYYPNFPIVRRHTFEKCGWISPDYKGGFGDCDFGMRIWKRGGVCEFSTETILHPLIADTGKTLDHERKTALFAPQDMVLFASRWGNRFGVGWKKSYLRGFNLDVNICKYPEVLTHEGRSVYHNDPSFRAMVGYS